MQKYKIPKLEARIYSAIFKNINSKLVLVTLIYRAGYIEDIEMFYVKEDPMDFFKTKLKESRHFAQIRYAFLITNQPFDFTKLKDFTKPLIVKQGREIFLINLTKQEYEILKRRGYLKHSLNILKIILKIFNNEILS